MNQRKPLWLNKKIDFRVMHDTETSLQGLNLHTVCRQANCPNRSECYAEGTVTFLILGKFCTRDCAFCDVRHGIPKVPDADEPRRLATAVRRLGSKYVVITSVTRDDLSDGGAKHFAECVREVKAIDPNIGVEVLIPDLRAEPANIRTVVDAEPDIVAHNIETVPRLYFIRKGADYTRSLKVLEIAKHFGTHTKSGLMLGMGETERELFSTLSDLRSAGCDFLSLGQYLAPDSSHYPVREFIPPEKFESYRVAAMELGFSGVESGPYVRSSYHAHKNLRQISNRVIVHS